MVTKKDLYPLDFFQHRKISVMFRSKNTEIMFDVIKMILKPKVENNVSC